MRLLPPEPAPGDKITAELVRELIRCIRERQLLKGPNYTTSTGPNGTYLKLDLPQRQNFPRKPLPYEVRFDATLDSGDGGWKIYLPTEHLLSYDGEDIDTSDITGITAIGDANGDATGWYSFDDVDLQAEHVWLVVTIPDESAADGEDGEVGEEGSSGGSIEAEFASEEGQSVTGSTVVNICIAEVSYEEPEDEGGTPTVEIKQSVVGALHLGGEGGAPVVPDDVSTEFIPEPEEGEEPTGDEGKLQIFDFDSNESDSPEGFVERLKADTETGDIKLQSGSNIMLLARRNGKMVYIPLSADGKDPEDEKPHDPENDPCAHPGDNAPGGATSESIGGGGGGGVDGGAGGVPAGGDTHTGDDDCNCERI